VLRPASPDISSVALADPPSDASGSSELPRAHLHDHSAVLRHQEPAHRSFRASSIDSPFCVPSDAATLASDRIPVAYPPGVAPGHAADPRSLDPGETVATASAHHRLAVQPASGERRDSDRQSGVRASAPGGSSHSARERRRASVGHRPASRRSASRLGLGTRTNACRKLSYLSLGAVLSSRSRQ